MRKYIISLCDYSGNWARPFMDYGYTVILVDPKHRGCAPDCRWDLKEWSKDGSGALHTFAGTVLDFLREERDLIENCWIQGVIAQPVCTQFAGSGARWWKQKDAEHPELLCQALSLVQECVDLVEIAKPVWWVLENPVGRLGRLFMGKPVMTYQPHEYAGWLDEAEQDEDCYTKRTCLWGDFNSHLLKASKRDLGNRHGSVMWSKYGSASDATKEARSVTPRGFAKAFVWCHA